MESAVFCIYCGTPVARLVATPFTGTIGRAPLAPGKGYGIRSLVWTVVGWLALLTIFLALWLEWLGSAISFQVSLWFEIVSCLMLPSLLCIIAGIVYGIRGLNTEGWRYACTGLVLSALYILLIVLFFFFAVISLGGILWYW